MPDQIKKEFESYAGLWRTVSDTDKVGILARLEELLRRAQEASSVDLATEIENTIRTIQAQLDNSRAQ